MRLATRISLLIVVLATGTAALNAWLLGQRLGEHLGEEQERLILTLTRGIGEATARDVLTRNVLATRESLRDIVQHSPEIDYAYVLDFDSQLFADSFDGGFPSALMSLEHRQTGPFMRADFRHKDQLISDVAYPLIAGLDAELHLGFNHRHNQLVVKQAQRDLALTAASIALLGVLLALWYGRRVSRPLAKLREQLLAYGAGTLDRPKAVATRDGDVDALWQTFDRMVAERRNLDQQLRDSERYNRMLFETSPVGLALTRMDGQLVDANPAFAHIIGRDMEEAMGLSYWQITPEDYADEERVQLARLRKHQRYGPYEKEYQHKDGHRVPVRLNGRLIVRDGEEFIWSAVEDISEVRAATERQRMLSTILEASPDFAGTATLDGRVVYVNHGGRRMLGVGDEEDLTDTPIADMHPPRAFQIIAEQGIPAALRRGVWRGESVVLRRDGSEVPVAMAIVTHKDASGKPVLMSAIMSDISALKTKEQELLAHRRRLEDMVEERTHEIRQQARIIDQTHDAIVTCDLEGTITTWNQGAEELFDLSRVQAVGQPLALIYPDGEAPDVAQLLEQMTTQGSLEQEPRLQRANGSSLHGHLSLNLLYDEEQQASGLVAYALDITERKRNERELHKLASDLQSANQELESFTYSVSHDLRSPLRALDGFSLALLEDYGGQLDTTAHGYLGRVRAAAQHMGRLIDDLLQLSRVSRSPLVRQRVDLSALAAEVIDQLQATEPDRRVDVRIEPGLHADGDPGLLRVVMDNLLGNAWKYTAKRDAPRIQIGQRQDETGTVFIVQDNGAGFNMKYAGKLFGAFQRLHHADEFPGTGVGLATVARIIRRHGGRVWAEAEVDKGASFYFALPSTASTDATENDSPERD